METTTLINRKYCPKNVEERKTVIQAQLKKLALHSQKRGRKSSIYRPKSIEFLWCQANRKLWPNMRSSLAASRQNNFR